MHTEENARKSDEKGPLKDRDTPREGGGERTVSKLVYKSQLKKFYGESDYLFNKNFIPPKLRKDMGFTPVTYRTRQYFKPKEFQFIIDYHQLSKEEIDEILNHKK